MADAGPRGSEADRRLGHHEAGPLTIPAADRRPTADNTLSRGVSASLDIKPGKCPNSPAVNVNNRGRIPMAIFGSADFHVADIKLDTVAIKRTGLKPVKAPTIEAT
jgi:hypothetical protein